MPSRPRPFVLNRTRCDLGRLMAVVVMNSANANACTGEAGTAGRPGDAAGGCAETLGVPAANVAVCSTGIIGVQLDAGFMAAGARLAAAAVKPGGGPDFDRSHHDHRPLSQDVRAGGQLLPEGTVRLGVCAKGAGMISPAMATMICVVTTDAVLTSEEMQILLDEAVGSSFNRVTVDGEMSTNDTVLFFASGASGVRPGEDGLAPARQRSRRDASAHRPHDGCGR